MMAGLPADDGPRSGSALGERYSALDEAMMGDPVDVHRDRPLPPAPDATVLKPAVENDAPRHTLK
jgi:hypothetical protein